MKKKLNIRLIMQIIFFALILLISLNHNLQERGIEIPIIGSASLHALCPYGGVETFVSLVTAGIWVKKIHESAAVLMSIVLFLSIFFGPVFCSYICPLGTLQEWLGKLGRKLLRKRYNQIIPPAIDRYLRFIRYGVLIWTVYLTTQSLKLVFEAYDPYYALFNFWTGEVAVSCVIILSFVLLLSLIVERPWCKYACPLGALLGLTNHIKLFKVRRNKATCINCAKCTKECPMNIKVDEQTDIKDHQCISCGICTSEQVCPVEKTVSISNKSKPQNHISSTVVAITIILVLVLGITVAKWSGVYRTESSKIPRLIAEGEFKGQYDPSDIRGSYTFQNVSDAFGIPVNILAKAFGVNTSNSADFQLKALEEVYTNVGTSSMREFTAMYIGIPYQNESDGLPITAIQVLLDDGCIDEEQYQYLIEKYHSLNNENDDPVVAPVDESVNGPVEAVEESSKDNHSSEEQHSLINGNSIIQDALDMGITKEQLEEVLGTALHDTSLLIKDVAKGNGLRFSEIKDILNAMLEE